MSPGKPEQGVQQNPYPQSFPGSSSVCERTPEEPSHSPCDQAIRSVSKHELKPARC